jgi:hypothetical protein
LHRIVLSLPPLEGHAFSIPLSPGSFSLRRLFSSLLLSVSFSVASQLFLSVLDAIAIFIDAIDYFADSLIIFFTPFTMLLRLRLAFRQREADRHHHQSTTEQKDTLYRLAKMAS